MKQLAAAESLQTFQLLFRSAQHDMFKAEVLQNYTAIDDCPSLRAWLNGDTKKARALGKTDASITSYRQQCLKSPAHITRVHAVQQPYTAYLEWEIAVCYKDSLLAHGAESVLLAPIEKITGLRLPEGDFWIFDDQRVLQWDYEHASGQIAGGRLWDENHGDDINYFRQLQKLLLAVATRLA